LCQANNGVWIPYTNTTVTVNGNTGDTSYGVGIVDESTLSGSGGGGGASATNGFIKLFLPANANICFDNNVSTGMFAHRLGSQLNCKPISFRDGD
jgi:hypothetical protein